MTPLEWTRMRTVLGIPTDAAVWRHLSRPLTAIVSRDMGRLHMSVSHRARIPTWEELGIARDALLPPELHFVLLHPPRRYWINFNSRVLHLWESRDKELIELAEWEGAEAQTDPRNRPPDSGDG